MNSCLYECRITHARFAPRPHRFLYQIFLFAIDLDELPTLHRDVPLFSVDRRNFYSFRDHDFLPTSETLHHAARENDPAPPDDATSVKQRVARYLAARGLELGSGRVVLVALPRVA